MTECRFPDCGRPARSKGLCDAHRHQQLRGTPLHPVAGRHGRGLSRIIGCQIDGCDQPHFAKGLCAAHYRRRMQPPQPTPAPLPEPTIERTIVEPRAKLPKNWDRVTVVKRRKPAVAKTPLSMPVLAPMDPRTMAACLLGLQDLGASDLADVLGVTPDHIRAEHPRWQRWQGAAA